MRTEDMMIILKGLIDEIQRESESRSCDGYSKWKKDFIERLDVPSHIKKFLTGEDIITNIKHKLHEEYLESLGYTKNHTIITEKDTDLVTISHCKVGESAMVIMVKCPVNKKIVVKGVEEICTSKAYTLQVKFANKDGVELNQFTPVRMNTWSELDGYSNYKRVFYNDIKFNNDSIKRYKFETGFELYEGKTLDISVYTDIRAPFSLPDIEIEPEQTKIELEVDVWSK